MKGFYELHEAKKAELIRRADGVSPARAQEAACLYLEDIRALYNAQEGARRNPVGDLCAVARSALGALGAASAASVRALPASEAAPQSLREKILKIIAFLPAALMLLSSVWALFEDEPGIAAAAFAACCASLLFTFTEHGRLSLRAPKMEAEPLTDGEELARRMAFLFREIDAVLDAAPTQKSAALPRELLEPVQMLMEAHLTGDGHFALKTLPRLTDVISRLGITILPYSEKNAGDFDLFPAQEGGRTIRPALVRDGEILLRGQATVKAS